MTERLEPHFNAGSVTLQDLWHRLDTKELMLLADFFDSQGMALRNRAVDLATRKAADEAFEEKLKYLATEIPRAVRTRLRAGLSLVDACAQVSAFTGVQRDTVTFYWRAFLKDKSPAARDARDNLIVDLAKLGLMNAEIAERVSVHPNSVPRILKEMSRRRCILRPERPIKLPTGPEAAEGYKQKLAAMKKGPRDNVTLFGT